MKKLVYGLLALLLVSCTVERPNGDERRYVVTSPEIGEIIYLLEGSDNIVGVVEEVDYPPQLQEIYKVGSFGAISREKVIALRPNIVFISGLEQEYLGSELNKLEIPTVTLYPRSIDEMLSGIRTVATHLEIEERGVAVADSLRSELNRIRLKDGSRPRVYVEIYGNPIMSASKESFVGELVELSGGDNIFSELPRDYSRVKVEEVISADPEIIVLTYPGVGVNDVKSRKGWQNIAACRNDRIYTVEEVDPDLILRAGPRSVEGAKLLNSIFGEL